MTICTRCLDTKILHIPDDTYLDGYRLERCGCFLTDKDLNIPSFYTNKTFDTFNFEGTGKLKRFVSKYVEEFQLIPSQKGLFFYGGVGVGKTHLAIALLRELVRTKGIRGRYTSYLDLLDLKRRSIVEGELFNFITKLETAELLVLDDLGAERGTEWVEEQTGRLIDLRYRNSLPLIITTNYPSENLKARFSDVVVGYRVVSRIFEMCFSFDFGSTDRRRKQNG